MPYILDPTGLVVKTKAELVAYFTTQYQTIYGPDINLAQDTPDGQMMMIFIQAILDVQDKLVQVYNGFDPDNAIGNILDQRVAINGIQREAGTFTVTPIDITVDRALNLYGLDQTLNLIYTVKDNAGTEWQLQASQVIGAAGTYTFNFQAAIPGAVLSLPNTITLPVVIVLGVTAINNPTTYSVLGLNEESDMALKIRRQKSVSLSSIGFLEGLLAALLNLNGMDTAFVYENNTDITDGDGTPSHTIWVIVAGSALPSDIAQVIYEKRNAGAGMRGAQTFVITQVDSSLFTVRWDNVQAIPLFIKFDAHSIDGINPPQVAAIQAGLVNLFKPGVHAEVNINELATIVQEIDPNTLCLFTPTVDGFSFTNVGPWTSTLQPLNKNEQFEIIALNIAITIV